MIAGLILAGGRSTRMGGQDKARAVLDGEHLLGRAIRIMRPQVGPLAVSSNGSIADIADGLPLLQDRIEGYQGPLAGIHAALSWAESMTEVGAVASVSVDSPFVPADFAERLARRALETRARIVLSASAGRQHPTCALWHVSLLADLETFLREGSSRRVMDFVEAVGFDVEEFTVGAGPDPFFNVNTDDDLRVAQRILADMS